jgi:hypothetical protein
MVSSIVKPQARTGAGPRPRLTPFAAQRPHRRAPEESENPDAREVDEGRAVGDGQRAASAMGLRNGSELLLESKSWELQYGSSNLLCQNCVTYPPKPRVNTMIYRDTPMHIVVAEVVDPRVRWWDLVRVSTRGRVRFPSVLLKPLGHLSARVESIAYSLWQEASKPNRL